MSRRWAWIVLAVTAGAVIVIRSMMLPLPLERDEGEFALMGGMILDGIPPWQEAYNLKPPGIYLSYAAVMGLFGRSAEGIHAGLLLVTIFSGGMVFALARRLAAKWMAPASADDGARHPMTPAEAAALSAAAFLALSSMPRVLGLNAHATQFLILPALGALLLLTGPDAGRKPVAAFFAGALMGTSFLVKQPGIFFVALGFALVATAGWRGAASYAAGVTLPIGASLVWLWSAGVFERFWFWVVTYALAYGSSVGITEAAGIAWSVGMSVVLPAAAIWALGIVGFVAAMRTGPDRSARLFTAAFWIASILAVAMGLHFRRHYFVLLIPAIAIYFPMGIEKISGLIGRWFGGVGPVIAPAVAILALAQVFVSGWEVYGADPRTASRALFGTTLFVESPAIASRIRELTSDGDRIAVVGSEPQLYFYSGRLPATGYLYTYSLVENQPHAETMREEMIREIERSRPALVAMVSVPSSWLLRSGSDLSLFRWARQYCEEKGYAFAGRMVLPGERNFIELWQRKSP